MNEISDKSSKPFVVTVGLPYANGPIHIGHLRGLVVGDTLARAISTFGRPTVFVSGSDMHGTPISVNAEEENKNPSRYAEDWHEQNSAIFPAFDIDFDRYGHTHTDVNRKFSKSVVSSLENNGHVIKRQVEVAWDPVLEESLDDRYIQGTCPYCGERARGDECDDGCGRHLEPGEITNPRNTLTGTPAEFRTRERHFLDLSSFDETLSSFVTELEGTTLAKQQARSFVDSAPDSWCISRELDWGVPYPSSKDDVLYVWVDALTCYISVTKELAKDTNTIDFSWEELWTGDRSDVVHVIGKDIIEQHSVYWPAILEGVDYGPPRALVATGFVTLDGTSFSTSRNRAVWAEEYLDTGLPTDFLRYFLVAGGPIDADFDFSWEALQTLVNDDLVGTLGKFFEIVFNELSGEDLNMDVKKSNRVNRRIEDAINTVQAAVKEYRLLPLAETPITLARYGLHWLEYDTDPLYCEATDIQLTDLYRVASTVTALAEPILPCTTQNIWNHLGRDSDVVDVKVDEVLELPADPTVTKPDEPLYEPISDDQILPLQQTLSDRIERTT